MEYPPENIDGEYVYKPHEVVIVLEQGIKIIVCYGDGRQETRYNYEEF